ncbi:nucleoside 2-deoxyribosyltransferase [Lapidilactobacillus wuchangensis]|uniref:nucleoside 2-deoxyribosyltransferase n=1 Tax=Lapidilactobacillus wuchangensis TaxID=2486001 RepID=UPI000F78DADE|nr:nucleoside 2-deoxyribosyltransferase [Lapidilactobacillus wuchangensis]
MAKIYLAGPFFDEAGTELQRLEAVKAALAKNPTVDSVFSPKDEDLKSPIVSQLPFMSAAWQKAVFENDLRGLKETNVLLVITDSASNTNGSDDGTAFEVGYWFAMNQLTATTKQPIVLYAEQAAKLNLMIAQSADYYTTAINDLRTLDFNQIPQQPYQGVVN